MRLSLSEIRANAMAFAAEWKDASSERQEAQSFWNDFFAIFGLKRRSVASFEEKVRNLKARYDRIDVFYSGVMIGEHKSRGEDLSAAASQAFDYVQSLTREGRGEEAPQFIIVSDFARIVIYDLDGKTPGEPAADFPTAKLHENLKPLGFLSGYSTKPVDPEDSINIEAVEILGRLHDALESGGYSGHELERFLVRILFCLFAEDTGIFDPDAFKTIVEDTHADGRDLGAVLARLFNVLNTDQTRRRKSLPEGLKELPFVNGQLFAEDLGFADFNGAMRSALLACCALNWAKISPAVFGSLFQSIMAGEEGRKKRRQIGAHYTSERDIMKVVRSLFLDDLKAELLAAGKERKKLMAFQIKLASLRFLDPACGCGNFLVVTYRELRRLELEVLKLLHGGKEDSARLMLDALLKVDVDQMYGIEIEEWPARIGEVAMWLIDHQMNQEVGEAFGQPLLRLPLKKSAKICVGNALRTDWNSVLPAEQCSFVLGNPPFVGKKEQNAAQKADMGLIWGDVESAGILDYVTCWYRKAIAYIRDTSSRCALVSTNSITQGEQVAVFWGEMFRKRHAIVHFAHRTFAWMSEARGKAHVHVVIIGFGLSNYSPKRIFEYELQGGTPKSREVNFINAYLWDAADVLCAKRMTPLNGAPPMVFGSKIVDDGHFVLDQNERDRLLVNCPEAAPFVRPFIGGEEFLNGTARWVLWLKDAPPNLVRGCSDIRSRVDRVREFRASSKKLPTVELATIPAMPGEDRQPQADYLLFPKVSSERRLYIPLGFITRDYIANGSSLIVPNATPYHFGILSSSMHNSWMRVVCGRMKSDYQYSNTIVYNNYPWPSPVVRQKAAVEAAAQAVLDAREQFKGQTLADLYDPLAMPKLLRDAHKALDRAVDKCYRSAPFDSERQRVEYLFDLYQRLIAPLTAPPKRRSKKHQTR